MVPYVTLGDLDPLQAEVAELSENLCRKDLTWQERAAATARISALRTAQAAAVGDPPPPVSAIAEEVRGSAVGDYQTSTRREIILAKMLSDPEIAAAPSLKEAWKVAQKKESVERNVKLAESVGRSFSAASHTLVHADSIDWLADCPADRFDCILTDPPYGMDADKFGDGGGAAAGAHGYADDDETYQYCHNALIQYAFRVCKPQAHLYWFCDLDRFHLIKMELAAAGWWVHRTPLIWHKTDGQRVPWPMHGPRRRYELILYAVKGKRLTLGVFPDVLSYPSDPNTGHAAQKPIPLLRDLLRRTCRPGDSILDPFSGSGSTVLAGHEEKCYVTAIEKDAGAYGLMLKRAGLLKETAVKPASNFGLAPLLQEGTTVCSFCRFPLEECICK